MGRKGMSVTFLHSKNLRLTNHKTLDKHLPDGIDIEKFLKLDFQNLYQKKY